MKPTIKSTFALFVLAVSLIASGAATAQKSRFGISVNSLTTNFNYGKSNDALQPYKRNYKGLQAGFTYQIGITPMISLVPELYFALKGGTLMANNPITTGKSTLRTSSLDLPVLARVHFGQFYLNAGPYASYTLAARLKTAASTVATEVKVSIPVDETGIRRFDYGFQAGAGYNFKLKKAVLGVDARYGYGLANLSTDVDRYSRMFNLSVTLTKPRK